MRIDDVPELTLPIIKPNRDYFCQYCDKVGFIFFYFKITERVSHVQLVQGVFLFSLRTEGSHCN